MVWLVMLLKKPIKLILNIDVLNYFSPFADSHQTEPLN